MVNGPVWIVFNAFEFYSLRLCKQGTRALNQLPSVLRSHEPLLVDDAMLVSPQINGALLLDFLEEAKSQRHLPVNEI